MGMTARLGFAVSTAWAPDILLIDEVLSVGDEGFQRKCHARLDACQRRGATIVIVSHNADILLSMCSRMLWLDRGIVRHQGIPSDTVKAYHQALASSSPPSSPAASGRDRS
jgi:ABC-type polysaccharide/polyol phosphate transport system ATPase subunit